MINLSYVFDQNSCSLEISGIPDVSNGDSEKTIGILTSWKLRIIGSPLLEGEKKHLENLMQVILKYSRSYISGIRTTIKSNLNIVTLSPHGVNHKLSLNSTREDVKPLDIILDDSELSDLTRCLDLLRYDNRFNLNWNISLEKPYSKRFILSNQNNSRINLNLFYSIIIFISSCVILLIVPIDSKFEIKDSSSSSISLSNEIKY